MELDIVRADPAGNITVFVMNPPESGECRAAAVKALLADSGLKAEQVGFVSAPINGLWTLEMMGGEFCGNASRSFGLLAAGKTGISGRAALTVKVSGAARPLEVIVDTQSGYAEIEVPAPVCEKTIRLNNRIFPLYVFDGISHVIAEDIPVDQQLARELLNTVKKTADTDACGFLFFDSEKNFLQPLVWVRSTETFISESSCGSGTAALAVWRARNAENIDQLFEIRQPGGIINSRIIKRNGVIQHLSIGGIVRLSEQFRFKCL